MCINKSKNGENNSVKLRKECEFITRHEINPSLLYDAMVTATSELMDVHNKHLYNMYSFIQMVSCVAAGALCFCLLLMVPQ